MKKQMINQEHVEGRVYQHDLAIKTVQNQASENFGKEFIAGSIDVAVDEEGLNVIKVHFTYVTETTKKGGKNATYSELKKIINEGKAWVTDGKDAATKVKIDTALALNDFYGRDGNLVAAKRNEGGFVSIVAELCPENERNTFTTDMLITSVTKVEANEEKDTPEYLAIRGAVFNFRNDLLPVEFSVKNPAGMQYFESLGVTPAEPVFTKVWGRINSTTSYVEQTEESAFGEGAVKTYERKTKEWVITGTAKVAYDYGDEEVLTADEVTKAMQAREVHLAEVKKKNEEFQASKAAASPAPTSNTVAAGGFNF